VKLRGIIGLTRDLEDAVPYRPFGKSRVGGLFPVGDQWPDPPSDAGPPTPDETPSGPKNMLIGTMGHDSVPRSLKAPRRRRGITGTDIAVLFPIAVLLVVLIVALAR
jgi:hypothetical protein